jgi:hypothetical protein
MAGQTAPTSPSGLLMAKGIVMCRYDQGSESSKEEVIDNDEEMNDG